MCTVVINLSAAYRSIIKAKQCSSGVNTEMITSIENKIITILL